MKNAIIEVKNIVKKYKTFTAVKGVSFEVKTGEIFGLLGPNGAGKTTTLEIIETLIDETEGDVILDGFSINRSPNRIKEIIGIQLQESGFYPGLKLKEILQLFAGLYNVNIEPIKILNKVGLGDKSDQFFKNLSGGQKQRFSIGTTLINSPKIIFLDEPTTGLDPQARRNLWELIKEINSNKTTIVMTTHYMDEAEYLCDRVGIMNEGEIIALDTPDNLIEKLIKTGFKTERRPRDANLEDVFINMTGKELKDE